MSKRLAQRGYGFVIAAANTVDGRTLMVASQCVRDIEIDRERDENSVYQWGGNPVRSLRLSEQTKITATLAEHPSHDALVHINCEQGGYTEAWRRLFNVWVPPQFTDETKSQILTHYTFGDLP